MSKCRIDAVILDFGGVIAEEGFAQGIKAIARAHGRDEQEVWKAGLESVWDSGYVYGQGSEADFWRLFKERTGLVGDEEAWRDEVLSLFTVRPFMRELTQRLKTMGVVTAILSDQTDWLAVLDERQEFSKHFDMVFNSYHHGMTKREPEFFLLALRELNMEPGRVVFVDDNPGNVDRARELGMHAILYCDQGDFEERLARLCPGAFE
jgi:putative hydrolase of the HAD superfamily